jgi:uncharacterized protein YjiK
MTGVRRTALAVMSALAACGGHKDDLTEIRQSPAAVARASRLERAMANHNVALAGEPLALWNLPPALKEISGLALTKDGRLLTHGDETSEISEVDYRRGILVKHFWVGDHAVKGDFEGITIANDMVFLLNSNGRIYQFKEGAEGAHVPYQEFDTGLKKACEFEGIAFDPAIQALLLACKHVHDDKGAPNAILIYRWSLTGDSTSRLSKLTVPLEKVLAANGWKNLHPSDITIDPFTGDYVLISSLERALIEITPAGEVVFARSLPERHHQAEGVAITKDSLLIVSDEAKTTTATITLYKWP